MRLRPRRRLPPPTRPPRGEDAPRVLSRDQIGRPRRNRSVHRIASGPRSSRTITSSSAQGKSEATQLIRDGRPELSYGRLSWSPDSKTLVAFRIEPGERKEVYLIQSSPPGGGRAKFRTRPDALPGDKFNAYELILFDVAAKKSIRPDVDRIDFGTPQLRWDKDGRHFTYEKIDRGHQRFRLIRVDSQTGAARNLIDEKSKTFIWTAHREGLGVRTVTWLDDSDELIFVSERDGWRHLYLIDAKTGAVKNPITTGRLGRPGRRPHRRGEAAGLVPRRRHPDRVRTPTTSTTAGSTSTARAWSLLTEGTARTRSALAGSPLSHRHLFAGWICRRSPSCAAPPTASCVCKLEQARHHRPCRPRAGRRRSVFVAKGRDGKTDIYGVICRPTNFDPTRKYPVIESIYAGPQGSFVPKASAPSIGRQALAELGFIVVQIDGMGTANRSKAFHDVCWKNLADAGFPDRILWHQGRGREVPVHGPDARGDLRHLGGRPERARRPAVPRRVLQGGGRRLRLPRQPDGQDLVERSSGWAGPIGPQYAEQSNVDNAHEAPGQAPADRRRAGHERRPGSRPCRWSTP